MAKLLFATALLVLVLPGLLLSGTTGKISGLIIDGQTGDGLPGANVQIDGTTLGAATDVDGNFTILNIPPGLYTVNISFIGYQPVRVKDVRVNVDFTTRIDQKLKPSAVEMAAVEVYGERNPLVRQDLTNTLVAVTAEKIEALPVDQISDVIALQAGIIADNEGALHIRGGRSNEIAYQVNGLSINNPFSNAQGVGLATNAVEEVSVSAGTFSAEYGDALSGVINFVTKDGGPAYHGSLRFWTGDNFTTKDDIFFNAGEQDLFNNNRFEWTLSGPVPLFGNKLTFFSSGVRQQDDGVLYGIRIYEPNDWPFFDENTIAIDPGGLPRTIEQILAGERGTPGADGDRTKVPLVTRDDLNITGKLTFKPTNTVKFTYDIIFDDGESSPRSSRGVNMFRRFRFNPDGKAKIFSRNTSHSFGLTHTLNEKTFYTLKFGANFTKRTEGLFEDVTRVDRDGDGLAETVINSGYFPNRDNDIGQHIIPPTAQFVAGGNDLFRSLEKSRTLSAKLDVTSQVLPSHEVKFGAEFKHHRLELEEFTLLFDFDTFEFFVPFPELDPEFTEYQAYTREPIQASFYVLDKIELSRQFILNLGLRGDYLDTRAPFNPNLAGTVDAGVDDPQFLQEASAKLRLSPRASLSFPITDRGIIRFSYGFFYQNPTFRSIYRNPRFEDFDFRSIPTFGNPNLEPERSIQYEFGLQQQFTDDFKADLTVFYKDVNNLIQNRRIIAGDVALNKEFNVVTNISYANVRGFTLSLLKRRAPGGIFSASLDYTFQVGEGAFDDPTRLAVDSRTGRESEQEFVPLDFDRTHTMNATVTFSKVRNWVVSAIGNLQSGTPYTPSVPSSVQAVQFDVNSARRPFFANLDLKLEKFFNVDKTRFSVFMQVENVLDIKNERLVHLNTGRSLTSLDETTQSTLFNNLRRTIANDPGNFFPVEFLDDFYQREDFLGPPREIRWGVSYDF